VQLALSAKGFQQGEEIVSVAPEAEARVELRLVRSQAPAVVRGTVRGRSAKPLAATIRLVEAKLSTRADAHGEFRVVVPGGRYRVVISAPGYRTQTKKLEVEFGDQAIFNVDMHPEKK
jgi:hypothetical protein